MGLFGRAKQKDDTIEKMKVLLDMFEFSDLQNFCLDVIREKPPLDEEHLSKTQIFDFIWEKYHKGNVNFSQVKEYAIKHNIVTENFFE